MIKYFPLLLLSIPLLACAEENQESKTSALEKQIEIIQSGKSDRSHRDYWHALLKWSDECESDFQYPPSVSGIDIYPEHIKHYIIQVMCTFGSNQGRQQFYFLSLENNKAVVKSMQFPVYEIITGQAHKKETTNELWGSVLNNSSYNKFILLNQYSGYGHCGTLTTYQIINGLVSATTLRAQPDCELENASRDAEQWKEYKIPVIK